MKKYKITLVPEEEGYLQELIRKGKRKAKAIRNAHVLLGTNESKGGKAMADVQIARSYEISIPQIERLRKLFVEDGLDITLEGKPREYKAEPRIDGEVEAHLIALCCGESPEGFARWSLRLLAGRMVELQYIDSISHESVRQVLKKRTQALESERLGYSTQTEQ